ncbi:MAG: hypothetical protein WAU39_10070 [Polyangiales bacterium]
MPVFFVVLQLLVGISFSTRHAGDGFLRFETEQARHLHCFSLSKPTQFPVAHTRIVLRDAF